MSNKTTNLSNQFNYENYIYNYPDILNLYKQNKNKILKHWLIYGIKEGRTCDLIIKTEDQQNYDEFDWIAYLNNNKDKKKICLTKNQSWINWVINDKKDSKKYYSMMTKDNTNNHLDDCPNDCPNDYPNNYPNDTKSIFEVTNYLDIVRKRKDFNWTEYINYYNLKTEGIDSPIKAWRHWFIHGKKEGRIFFTNENKNKINSNDIIKKEDSDKLILKEIVKKEDTDNVKEEDTNKNKLIKSDYDNTYLKKMDEFTQIYETNKQAVLSNPKEEFRYFCYRYLDYIRNIELPEIVTGSKFEAVLIEYRKFPHLEFIIRNAMTKLGKEWSFSVVCGNLNYEYIVAMCDKISPNIKIIKSNYDNLNQSSYSLFMASIDFWEQFQGEKILIYQEDSIIFKSNIMDFIDWDYIGAPWPKNQNDNPNCVGNGGFSLRTKQCMIDVINKVSILDTEYNSSTVNYMNATKMVVGPEDVYFSLNMIRYNIGKVADWESGFNFSSESFYNPDGLGGHNFWIKNPEWKKLLYSNIVIQFQSKYDIKMLEHRGGWKSVLENIISNDFFNNNSEMIFFDLIEKYFLWDKKYSINKKWAGIIHCTQSTPPFWSLCNINILFENPNFINALDLCICIISLSEYVADFLRNKFKLLGKNITVHVLKHPVDDNNVILFDIDKYNQNPDKKIVQIGQQLRKITSIYRLKTSYKKLWLTGTKDFNRCKDLIKKETLYLNIRNVNLAEVEMYYTKTFVEYDEILSKNIGFIDLFDASANNALLECILRNTPIIINKLPAIIEYLGESYPLYFNNLDEVNDLISDENIISAHEYLKKINKSDLKIDFFIKKVFSSVR